MTNAVESQVPVQPLRPRSAPKTDGFPGLLQRRQWRQNPRIWAAATLAMQGQNYQNKLRAPIFKSSQKCSAADRRGAWVLRKTDPCATKRFPNSLCGTVFGAWPFRVPFKGPSLKADPQVPAHEEQCSGVEGTVSYTRRPVQCLLCDLRLLNISAGVCGGGHGVCVGGAGRFWFLFTHLVVF